MQEIFWLKLKQAFDTQKAFWSQEEIEEKPGTTDRLVHYLISYFETPAVARIAIRIFRGLQNKGTTYFASWNEVRVASLREINDALIQAGSKGDTLELAITIKDFLENAWHTLGTVNLSNLSEIDPGIIADYLNQLRGISNNWFAINEAGKKLALTTPIRYSHDENYTKHLKKYRQPKEPILPECVIEFLEYCWKRTNLAPYEYHTDRILTRLGLINNDDTLHTKLVKFEAFMTTKEPVSKHKHLVQLGKVVCLSKQPRCNICPVEEQCQKKGFTL